MCTIESYIFFDIETTGLPWQEKNRTKITELSFVAVLRNDLIRTKNGKTPPVSKLTLVFNPTRPIHPDVVNMNGLSNDLLQYAPHFAQKLDTIVSFIQDLPKPVCLVAHNGNRFDYKILLAECRDANFHLPGDLWCVDSLVGFKNILSQVIISTRSNKQEKKTEPRPPNVDDLLTDDEDEWPDLNVSTEEWEDIDTICESLSDISCEDFEENTSISIKKSRDVSTVKKVSQSNVIQDVFKKNGNLNKEGYSLIALYRRLLHKEPTNHHRAENDCMMLLQCVTTVKEDFILWADTSCVKLTEIKPLIRY